jgi:hypothetical protein
MAQIETICRAPKTNNGTNQTEISGTKRTVIGSSIRVKVAQFDRGYPRSGEINPVHKRRIHLASYPFESWLPNSNSLKMSQYDPLCLSKNKLDTSKAL